MTDGQEIALKTLIRQRHMSYEGFCREWDRIAREIDDSMRGRYPAHAQYYRWLRGSLRNKRPYPDACRMLEAMFPAWSVEMLFSPYSEMASVETGDIQVTFESADVTPSEATHIAKFSDLAGAYVHRAEFVSDFPLSDLLENASLVRASGVSLNLITQHYSDAQIRRLVERGTQFQLIFLDPESEAMKLREEEEGYSPGVLKSLTSTNIRIMHERIQAQLKSEERNRFTIALSDDIVRFSIIIIDKKLCVFQPYLPQARGLDSPTFVAEAGSSGPGFFHVFEQVFTSLWKQAKIELCRLMPTYCGLRTLLSISRVIYFLGASQGRLPGKVIAIWRLKLTMRLKNLSVNISRFTVHPSHFWAKRRAEKLRKPVISLGYLIR